MKKILLATFALLIAFNSYAQYTPNFTWSQTSTNNDIYTANITYSYTPTTLPAGKYAKYDFDYGDGTNTVGITSPSNYPHVYTSAGTYAVKMKLSILDVTTSSLYSVDSITKAVTMTTPPCATSIAFTKNARTISVVATTPASTPGMTYIWDWSDGSPVSTGSSASHTYATKDYHQASLIASNGSCSYINSTGFMYFENTTCGSANFSYMISGPTASFTNTTYPAFGYIRNSSWDFGDGTTSTAYNETHSYTAVGVYTVVLTNQWLDSATSAPLCTDTMSQLVYILSVPTGIANVNAATDFAMYPNPAKDKVTVNWSNTTSNATITVTDITGKKVQQVTANNGKAEIMLQGQQKGLYFITLEANNVKTTKKLLLQ